MSLSVEGLAGYCAASDLKRRDADGPPDNVPEDPFQVQLGGCSILVLPVHERQNTIACAESMPTIDVKILFSLEH